MTGAAVRALGAACMALALAAGCGKGTGVDWVEVPVHRTRLGGLDWREAGGWDLARTEVTVGQWVAYLNAAGVADYPATAQVEKKKGGGYRAAAGKGDEAAAWISLGDAEGWCAWATGKEGRRVRLPRGDEWEAGARGGLDGARWPLGWSPPTPSEARYASPGPLARAGASAPNGWGLRDTAGNLHEWCAGGELRGGAWSDRDATALECRAVRSQRSGARSADTGFRPLREAAEAGK